MQLDNLFEALKLDHLAAQCDALLEQAAKKDLGYREVLTQALECECSHACLRRDCRG